MAWDHWPLHRTDDALQFNRWLELNYAFWERAVAIAEGCRTFPGSNYIYETGIITAVTNTSMTDSTKSWATDQWAGDPAAASLPSYLTACCLVMNGIDYTHPWKIVKVDRISSNTGTVLNFLGDIGLTSAELAELVGKRYFIMKQFGLWWHERMVPFPNSKTLVRGISVAGTLATPTGLAATVAGTAGETSYSYKVTAVISGSGGGETAPSTQVTIATGPDTLDETNYVHLHWNEVPGATSYRIYGRVAGSLGLLDSTIGTSWDDTGISTPGSAPPAGTTIYTLTDPTMPPMTDNFTGKKVGYYNTDNHRRYATVVSNTLDTVIISASDDHPSATSGFGVLKDAPPTGHWDGVGRDPMPSIPVDLPTYLRPIYSGGPNLWRWYAPDEAAVTNYGVQNPMNGEPMGVSKPKPEDDRVVSSDEGHCDTTEPIRVVDRDVLLGIDDECRPDKFHTPYIWRSPRQYQVELEMGAGQWVPAGTWSGNDTDGWTFTPRSGNYNGARDLEFTKCTFFDMNAITASRTTTSTSHDTDGGQNIQATFSGLPYSPIFIYFDVLRDGKVVASDKTFVSNGTDQDIPVGVFPDDTWDGLTIRYNFGWPRKAPKHFRHIYPHHWFMPDIEITDDLPPEVILRDPPTEDYPGVYNFDGPSTSYVEWRNFYGDPGNETAPGDFGTAYDWKSYSSGDKARHVGDNPIQGSIERGGYAELVSWDPDDPQLEYQTKGTYEGWYRQERQYANDPSMRPWVRGVATGGDRNIIYDSGKDWYHNPEGFGGIMRTESGTSTGGSTTTLLDEDKTGNGFWDASTGRWTNFVLRINSGVNSGKRRPITGFSGTTLTTWAFPSAIAAGVSYSIDEPRWGLNRWKGRWMIVTRAATESDPAQKWTARVGFSDKDGLYFDLILDADGATVANVDFEAGDVYKIVEELPGKVWQWDGSAWDIPTGATGIQTMIEPDYMDRYGRMMPCDRVTLKMMNDLWKGIDSWRKRKRGYGWTNNGENNQKSYGGNFDGEWTSDNADGIASGFADDTLAVPMPLSNHAPYASWTQSENVTGDTSASFIEADRAYAYPTVSINYCSWFPIYHSGDYYAFAHWPTKPHDEPTAQSSGHSGHGETHVFDDNGDGFSNDAWTSVGTYGSWLGGTWLGPKVGSLDVPTRPRDLLTYIYGFPISDPGVELQDYADEGYQITDQAGVLEYAFTKKV